MSENNEELTVCEVDDIQHSTKTIDIFVLASGFEDRAFRVLKDANFSNDAYCVIIQYENDIDGNEHVFDEYREILNQKFGNDRVKIVSLRPDKIDDFAELLKTEFSNFPPEFKSIGIDVSGMTSYVICLCLKYARKIRPFEKQTIFYTSAAEYLPSLEEYENLINKTQDDVIDYLPKAMALEMSENLVLEEFQGHSSGNARTCLAIFAGYEVHRSSGMIDAINPTLLLLMYGIPGEDNISWRLKLSKQLHKKFETGRKCATEDLSTLQIQESIEILEKYYDNLIDDYDLIIAPICSKMHSVAAYLFWERYGEVQLSFPLPIGYNLENRPIGVGATYKLELYEQRMLFRS